ncbi:MAG: 50S ribosomal protein L1 [Rhabdochlamydiaceae bacterium]|nr:50S ribosomal protein L1 [Candidatus Amphrikana amoebophyrae]
MTKHSRRFKKVLNEVDVEKTYTLEEAAQILKSVPSVKFDQSVDISAKLSVDPRKAEQQVRGTVSLPKGTGKKIVLIVFAQGDLVKEAEEAGADYVGSQDLFDKVKGGWTDFDVVLASPDMMREVGKLGKVLGPRGLMPSPKAGTVTRDIATAVKEIKAGKIEYKVDKAAVINNQIGKLSFSAEDIVENANTLISAIIKAKPSAAKGQYIQSLFLTSTMGPGMRIDLQTLTTN